MEKNRQNFVIVVVEENMSNIREKIIQLEYELEMYKREQAKLCDHENLLILSSSDYAGVHDEYLFVCDSCGKLFLSNDPNFKFKESL